MAWAWIENGHLFISYSRDVIPANVEVMEVPDDNPQVTVDNGQLRPKTDEEILNEVKSSMLSRLIYHTQRYIEQYYPETKQRSDIADKEIYESVLVLNQIDPTQVRANITRIVLQYYDNFNEGLQALLSIYNNQDLAFAFEQLLKVGYRLRFVYLVKQEYYNLKQSIENATSLDNLNTIQIQFQTRYPL